MGGFVCRKWIALALALNLGVSGCATSHYREAADRETYQIVADKSPAVPGMEPEFTLDKAQDWDPLEGLPELTNPGRPFSDDPEAETGFKVLSLEKALEIAVRNSRTYQNEKEILYLAALSLTLDRHRFGPRFSAGARGDYARDTSANVEASELAKHVGGARDVAEGIDAVAGTSADLLRAYANVVEAAGAAGGVDDTQTVIDHDRSVSGSSSIGVSQLLKGGGLIALSLSSNFLRFLTGDPGTATASTLAARRSGRPA